MATTFMVPKRFVEFFYILIPIGSLVFFNKNSYNWLTLGVSLLLFHYTFIQLNFYQSEGVLFLPPLMIFLFSVNFLIVLYFKKLNIQNEKLLAIERDKALSDKITIETQSKELKKLNEFKSHFFVNLSHEIRTPITLIKGYTSKIKYENEENKKNITIVNSQIKQIEDILNNILDLSKLDADKLVLTRNHIAIIPFLNKIYGDFKELFNNKQILFTLNNNTNNITINIDTNLLVKSINNLLSNALKFTSKNGEVNINILFKDNLIIEIEDNGIGIPHQGINNIFDRFYQSENDITKSQGSGIGLSFTKSIIESHGFGITVKSTPNIKTVFKIIIPKQFIGFNTPNYQINLENNLHPKQLIKTPLKQDNNSIKKGPTLLIVDDHKQMRDYLSTTLNQYNTIEAENGKEALTILKNNTIDLLVTDYMMPVMDGESLVKEVKNLQIKIPIIILTARVDDLAKLNMLRIGVDGYLNKPFVEEELQLSVKNSLKLYTNIIETQKTLNDDEKINSTIYSSDFHQQIKKYIIDHISDLDLNIQQIADYFNMSKNTLDRRTKSITGLTTKQVVSQLKIETARELYFKKNHLSKKEIGFAVGIKNTSYLFNKISEKYGSHYNDHS